MVAARRYKAGGRSGDIVIPLIKLLAKFLISGVTYLYSMPTSLSYFSTLNFSYCRTYSLRPANKDDQYARRITNTNGELHTNAELIAELQRTESTCTALINCLRTEIEQELLLMCAPIYRDAILFYDTQHQLLGGINICFECDRIEFIAGEHIRTDFKTFKCLKQLLLSLSHPIEQPDYFQANEIERLRKSSQ